MSAEIVFECPKSIRANDACIKAYTDSIGLKRVSVPDDGNCFYHTLSNFFQLTGTIKSHHVIRAEVVKYMMEHLDEMSAFILSNNTASIYNKINAMRQSGIWDSDAGDLIAIIAARLYRLRLNIYDFKKGQTKPYIPRKIIKYSIYSENTNNAHMATVNMLRINDNHYELLFPMNINRKTIKSVIVKNGTVKRTTRKNKNKNNNNSNHENAILASILEVSKYNANNFNNEMARALEESLKIK